MEHFFELPVVYKGEERSLPGRLVATGYVYQFYITINGHEYIFEKDDEQNYRVLDPDGATNKPVDNGLLAAIVETLKNL
jgi:hypothetical protein